MVVAVLLLPLADLGVALVAAPLARGASRTYPVLTVNHLVTMGWGTLLAMGSVHRLFPAMIAREVRAWPWGSWSALRDRPPLARWPCWRARSSSVM